MHVIMTPYDGDNNPYLRLLANSLEDSGIEVSLAGFEFFMLWSTVYKHGIPDLIHLHWHHQYLIVQKWRWIGWSILRFALFVFQVIVLRLIGVRFVWTVHNIVNHEKKQASWEIIACRLLARLIDSVIVHCETASKIVQEAYGISFEKIAVIPHGHYGDWYPKAENKITARAKLGVLKEDIVFLFFGSVRFYKGIDKLLKAFSLLDNDSAKLFIVGKPFPTSLGKQIFSNNLVDSRVTINFGFIPNESLVTYISACDFTVFPYRDSLTSGAAIMTASYGRPLIAPRQGCFTEFPEQAAILYEFQAVEDIFQALELALSARSQEMGDAAKEYIEQFPWSFVAERTSALYISVLPKSNLMTE